MSDAYTNTGGILLLYDHPRGVSAPTIIESVNAFESHSSFEIFKVNSALGFPRSLNRFRFQAIVLHYSLFGNYPFALNHAFRDYLRNCDRSYKVAFFQDEYQYCQERFDFINHHGIDCIFTLIEPQYFKDTYLQFTNVRRLVYYLTGYVSDELRRAAQTEIKSDSERTIDIGYRVRRLPFFMGKGALEKAEVADGFLERAQGLGLKLDISMDERHRINGTDWYRFMANCRGTLGAEAGISITDVDGNVRREYDRLMALNPAITYEEMAEAFLAEHEDKIPQRVIGPRHFEAAALRTCQILFEGKYSGVMKPGRHYLALKKDFSNFAEVIRAFRDADVRREITENAHRDLIASEGYTYRKLINRFDAELRAAGLQPGTRTPRDAQITSQLHHDRMLLELRARTNDLVYRDFTGRKAIAVWAGPPLRLLRKLRRVISDRKKSSA